MLWTGKTSLFRPLETNHIASPSQCPALELGSSYLVPGNLGLQLLDVAGGHRLVLNLSVSSFYELLEVLHFLLVLFILHHSLL